MLANPTPGDLQQAGEDEGEKEQGQGFYRDIHWQGPEQGDPEFCIPCANPTVCPSEEQADAYKPDIGIAGEVCEKASHNQWEGSPVWDAARAQVVQAEEEHIDEQPGHWLRMILNLGWGCGESVG